MRERVRGMRERVREVRERVRGIRERVSARACLALRCQWVPGVWRIGVGLLPHYLPVSTLPWALSIGVSDLLPEGGEALNHMIANLGTDNMWRQAVASATVVDSACLEGGLHGPVAAPC